MLHAVKAEALFISSGLSSQHRCSCTSSATGNHEGNLKTQSHRDCQCQQMLVCVMHKSDTVLHNMSNAVCLPVCLATLKSNYISIKLIYDVSRSFRYRRCGGHHDSRAQRSRDHGPAGEEHHRGDAHQHRDTEPAEVRQSHIRGVRLHFLHRPHDHLAGLAGLLLHPEVPLRQRTRSQSGRVMLKTTENKRNIEYIIIIYNNDGLSLIYILCRWLSFYSSFHVFFRGDWGMLQKRP